VGRRSQKGGAFLYREKEKGAMKDQTKFPPLPDDGLGLPDLQQWIEVYGDYDTRPGPNGISFMKPIASGGALFKRKEK
jgi:hypothetical protein